MAAMSLGFLEPLRLSVFRGTAFLGAITETGEYGLWHHGAFDAARDFEAVRLLFDQERELIEAGKTHEWTVAWRRVSRGLRLESLDGQVNTTNIILHIAERRAYWQYLPAPPKSRIKKSRELATSAR
jgi:hypothetical protein